MPKIKVLVVDSEPSDARAKRKQHGRPTACESFITTLSELKPDLICDRVAPTDDDKILTPFPAQEYRAAFFSGSPLHFYEKSLQTARVLTFAELLFQTGLPCFGSCAGLQIATIVAGGEVGPKKRQRELGIARNIAVTQAGHSHFLLRGRPAAFDAPSVHSDEVKQLPDGALLLATSSKTEVQAAEFKVGRSKFYGVQYHPEVSLKELALALADQSEDAVEKGFAVDEADLKAHLVQLQALAKNPDRQDLAWKLAIDDHILEFAKRTVEIRNFLIENLPGGSTG